MILVDILNITVSWGLLVLIWLVQIIIYPGFIRIPAEDFVSYHRWYAIRISLIVLPLMLCEVPLVFGLFRGHDGWPCAYVAVLSVAVVWWSTFRLQVPIHRRLQSGKDDVLIGRLVTTNWIRTVAWSIKALAVVMAAVQNIA